MGYINIYVSNEAKIFVKNSQLFLENANKSVDYPLEDVSSVMIENLRTSVSTYTLSKFADFGILVFICNQNHLPCGVVLPFCEHYQTALNFEIQMSIKKPLQKQIWQSIVKNKIRNQNEVLNICGGNDELKLLEQSVSSGDSTNNEATASLIYFKKLFGKNFVRRDENIINVFLNYGYSIVRGFVARSIVVHGFLPYLGINHSNQYNAFNLADDLMEVFRPIVDLFVKIYLIDEKDISSEIKSKLFSISSIEVLVDDERHSLDYAVELLVQSFVKSAKEKKNMIKSVEICGLDIHNYE